MDNNLPKLSLKFVTLLLLLAGLGLSVGLSMERQVFQKQAAEKVVSSDPGSKSADDPGSENVSMEGTCSAETPDQPQNLRAWPGPNTGQVSLVWEPVAQTEDYLIQYTDDLSFWRFEVSSLGQVQTYTASDLDPEADYYFKISAVNDCAQSEPSNILIVKSYTDGVDTSVVYADQIDQKQFDIQEITPSEAENEEASPSTQNVPGSKSADDPGTNQADQVEEPESQLETEPRILDQPEEKTTININWQQILTQIGPWILGAAAVWGVVTIIKLRINQVNQETEDLSKGTEISLEDLATPGVKSAETPGVTNALEEPVKPDYGPRPPVESPQA